MDASASSIAAENSREHGASTKTIRPNAGPGTRSVQDADDTKGKVRRIPFVLADHVVWLASSQAGPSSIGASPLLKRGTRIPLDTCYSLWFSARTSAIVIAIIAQPIVGPWRPYRLPKERYDLAPSCGP
jgi:hypothetical protein